MTPKKLLALIPHDLFTDSKPYSIELPDGMRAVLSLEPDDSGHQPWDDDGHGPVSDWRPKDSKKPGERILHTDRGSARFYDFAEAVKLARKDGWGAKGDDGLTRGAKAAYAAEKDFEFLSGWCTDKWCYIGVCVKLYSAQGVTLATDSLWGVESFGDYWREVAADCLSNCLHEACERARRAELTRCFIG